jgi:hypothetical protein
VRLLAIGEVVVRLLAVGEVFKPNTSATGLPLADGYSPTVIKDG